MNIKIYKDASAIGEAAAAIFAAQVISNPKSVLGLATGSSPIPTYKQLISLYRQGLVDFSQVTTFNLDEYIGLKRDHSQTYWTFMHENLFNGLDIPDANVHVPVGDSDNIQAECEKYEEAMKNFEVDIQLLGIGANGHIGFNEPGTSFDTLTHTVVLKEKTRQDNARFFDPLGEEVPTEAITMGIATIMKAKKILLVANGKNKADAVYAMIKGPVTEECPASVLQNHPDVTVIVDRGAASKL